MQNDLANQMRQRSDEELYDMLHLHRDHWSEEALELAEREFQSRGLSPATLHQLQTNTDATRQREEAVSNEPLAWPLRLLCLLAVPFGCLGIVVAIVVASSLKRQGYERKYRDVWTFAGYGFLLVLLGFLVFISLGVLAQYLG